MKTDPKNPSPVVGTDDPPKVSLSKAPNARRRGESAGQPGSGVSDETGNLFEPRSEEEERLIDAVLETEERPDVSNPEMPYDFDHARKQSKVKPRD